jgi:hypothetical protein
MEVRKQGRVRNTRDCSNAGRGTPVKSRTSRKKGENHYGDKFLRVSVTVVRTNQETG